MTLRDRFKENPEPVDIDFSHWDENFEDDVPTCVDFSMNDFTEAGLKYFEDILDAIVMAEQKQGDGWISMALSGCEARRLEKLARWYAGYCGVSIYNRYFYFNDTLVGHAPSPA